MDLKTQQEWNARGLIPGPDETEEEYIERVAYCQQAQEKLQEALRVPCPFLDSDEEKQTLLAPALEQTRELFEISPDWVPILFHNKDLAPWHGGCAWIYQMTEESPRAVFLQLRKTYRKNDTYLGLYSRKEIIAHEMVHVGRLAFEEPAFEEILAFQTSPSRFRRWWGPLFTGTRDSALFVSLLAIPLLWCAVAFVFPLLMLWAYWTFVPVVVYFFYLFYQLARRQTTFHRAKAVLTKAYGDERKAYALLFRLSDWEIRLFSKLSPEEVRDWIGRQESFRWRLYQ